MLHSPTRGKLRGLAPASSYQSLEGIFQVLLVAHCRGSLCGLPKVKPWFTRQRHLTIFPQNLQMLQTSCTSESVTLIAPGINAISTHCLLGHVICVCCQSVTYIPWLAVLLPYTTQGGQSRSNRILQLSS